VTTSPQERTGVRRPSTLWRRLGLRWRLLLIGTAGLSAGLLIGGALLLAALTVTFDRNVDAGATQTASDVVGLISAEQLPEPIAVAGTQLVQVIDGNNRVRAASPGVDRLKPLLTPPELARARSGRRFEIEGSRAGLDGPLRVLVKSAGGPQDRLSVIVAVPLGDTEQSIRSLQIALLALFLPLVLGLAAIAWWVIGRTLRPVEALRAGAEEITRQADAGGRLPVPAGADEIHRLAVTLNGMLARLESARRVQRQFVADAAHELRNPLAGMRTHLEVAHRHPSRVDWQELTEDLLTDTARLAALSDGLLLLAGVDEGIVSTRHSSPVPVAEALATVAARYSEDLAGHVPVQVRGSANAGALLVDVDPEDLHRIMTNLIDNAVRHARSGVWLAAEARGGQIRITVTDDGTGIPESQREFVFQRFARLDDARATDDGGSGLGLAIVAELVRRNDGTIRLDDADPGLLVEVTLPRADQSGSTED
jgi:signal transduction histidine kinase